MIDRGESSRQCSMIACTMVIHACKGLEDAYRFAMDIGPPRDPHDRRSYRMTITDGPLANPAVMLRHMPMTGSTILANTPGCDPTERSSPHRLAIAVKSASKPAGGSMAQTGVSANVSGCDTRLKSAMVLTVGISFSIARKISLTKQASDSARCSALFATFSRVATCSKLWLGHAGWNWRVISSVSNTQWGGLAMPNRVRAIARKPRSKGAL